MFFCTSKRHSDDCILSHLTTHSRVGKLNLHLFIFSLVHIGQILRIKFSAQAPQRYCLLTTSIKTRRKQTQRCKISGRKATPFFASYMQETSENWRKANSDLEQATTQALHCSDCPPFSWACSAFPRRDWCVNSAIHDINLEKKDHSPLSTVLSLWGC